MSQDTDARVELRKALRGPLRQVQKHVDEVAKRRDALRALLDDIEAICDSADEGVEDLQRGVNRLSEYL